MENKVKVLTDNKEKEYDLLFTVTDEKNGIKYVVCTDNTKDNNGNVKVYFARYEGNKIVLIREEEREKLEEVVNLVSEEVLKNEG